jgi:beta-lactam-binding protein with PASTA domain
VKGGSIVTLVVSRGPPKVAVPTVTGLAAADAVTKLQAAKLHARLVDVRSTRSPGTVVAQKPAAGAKAPQGSAVTLKVSKGGGKVTVPAVVGETTAQASSDLHAAGLTPATTSVASAQPRGTVISQTPTGGARVTKGATVQLKVSKGAPATTAVTTTAATTTAATTTQRATTPPPPATTTVQQTTTRAQATGIAVPSLVGKGIASALGALERAGLRATVKYQTSQAPVGQVRGQNPAAGARVPRGSRVQVNVSEGPNPGNPIQVPDETGQDQQTATSDLQSAGFKVVAIQRSGTGQSTGTVVEEQPSAGTTIATGDYVALYVAR